MKLSPVVRITTPVLAISLLPLTVGVMTAWNVQQSQRQASDALALNVVSMRAAEELAIGIRDVRTRIDHFLLSRDPRHLDAIPALRRDTDHWLAEAERAAVAPREQELIARVKEGYGHFFEEWGRVVSQPAPDGPPPPVRATNNDALTNAILVPAQEYLDFNEEEIARSSEDNQRMANRMVLALLLPGVCGPLSGLLAGFGIARGVSRSIVRLSVPIRDAAGKLNEIVGPITLSARWGLDELEGVLRTIADQTGAVVERLQQSQREVLRSEHLAAVGQLAAGMAHELRNPLMSMKILVQAAAARSHAAYLEGRDLTVLEEEISRLERLLQTFLDFARPPRPDKRAFEARAILRQVAGLVSARARQQGARLVCELPAEPVLLRADVGQVRQVVLNLVLNALDAVAAGGTVRVQLVLPEEAPGDRRHCLLRVSDTGRGLPADLGGQIFEPFISTKETGLGLGLSVCKRIVEAHGGEIQATNRPQGGAVFTVRLPLTAGGAVHPWGDRGDLSILVA